MSVDVTDPIDPEHEKLIRIRAVLRDLFGQARERAAKWEPRPMPDDFR
jgi:hypothetical protein